MNARIESHRRGDPDPRRDVRDRAREGDSPQPLAARDAERPCRVDRDGVDVADAVHRLDEDRPERAERRQEHLALEGRPEREEEQGNQRGRRDRPEELDRHAKRSPGEVAQTEPHPDRHREQDRDAEPKRPPAHGVAEGGPEVPGPGQRPSSSTVAVIDGRSVLADEPDRETSSQRRRANATEPATTSAFTMRGDIVARGAVRRLSAVASWAVVIRAAGLRLRGGARLRATNVRSRRWPCSQFLRRVLPRRVNRTVVCV